MSILLLLGSFYYSIMENIRQASEATHGDRGKGNLVPSPSQAQLGIEKSKISVLFFPLSGPGPESLGEQSLQSSLLFGNYRNENSTEVKGMSVFQQELLCHNHEAGERGKRIIEYLCLRRKRYMATSLLSIFGPLCFSSILLGTSAHYSLRVFYICQGVDRRRSLPGNPPSRPIHPIPAYHLPPRRRRRKEKLTNTWSSRRKGREGNKEREEA